MIRMAAKTSMSPEEAIKRAVAFFGPGGYGLEIKEQSASYICFEGGGGVVEVYASAQGKDTALELVSQEWDYQVKEFLGSLKGLK
jgi:hypothetical protein